MRVGHCAGRIGDDPGQRRPALYRDALVRVSRGPIALRLDGGGVDLVGYRFQKPSAPAQVASEVKTREMPGRKFRCSRQPRMFHPNDARGYGGWRSRQAGWAGTFY
jgi:hypothetical protein